MIKLAGAIAFAALLISGCSNSSGERAQRLASRADLELRLSDFAKENIYSMMALLVPECLKSLQDQPVDEALLAQNGFVKKKALLGDHYYTNIVSKAGLGKSEVSSRIAPNTNGGCTINKSANSFDRPHYADAVAQALVQQGFSRSPDDGGALKNKPAYDRNGFRVVVTTGTSSQDGTGFVYLRKK